MLVYLYAFTHTLTYATLESIIESNVTGARNLLPSRRVIFSSFFTFVPFSHREGTVRTRFHIDSARTREYGFHHSRADFRKTIKLTSGRWPPSLSAHSRWRVFPPLFFLLVRTQRFINFLFFFLRWRISSSWYEAGEAAALTRTSALRSTPDLAYVTLVTNYRAETHRREARGVHAKHAESSSARRGMMKMPGG